MKWKDLDHEVQAHIEEKALELIDAGIPGDGSLGASSPRVW